jgi:hypothetical protein
MRMRATPTHPGPRTSSRGSWCAMSETTAAFTTFQTFQPVDGRFYKVESFSPVVFIPLPHFRIDTSIPDAPKVIREGREIGLNDAISQGFVTVADRWEKPIELPATA